MPKLFAKSIDIIFDHIESHLHKDKVCVRPAVQGDVQPCFDR